MRFVSVFALGILVGAAGCLGDSLSGDSDGGKLDLAGIKGPPCVLTCDCAPGLECLMDHCVVAASGPVYCCGSQLCPAGAVCDSLGGMRLTCDALGGAPDLLMPLPRDMGRPADGNMGPKACTVASDCDGACPPGSLGCACVTNPQNQKLCVPTCAETKDCPLTPEGAQLTCRMGICAP